MLYNGKLSRSEYQAKPGGDSHSFTRSYTVRERAALALSALLIVLPFRVAESQVRTPAAEYPSLYQSLEERGAAARNHDPDLVREFVHAVFDRVGHANAAPSLKERITAAEMINRLHGTDSVAIGRLVRVTNKLVDDMGLPSYFRTSVSQVRVQQHFVDLLSPNSAWRGHSNSPHVAPAEAVFMVLFLVQQKSLHPLYQVDPDAWAQRERTLMIRRPDRAFLVARARVRLKNSHEREFRHLRDELRDENSLITKAAHKFLDDLGILR